MTLKDYIQASPGDRLDIFINTLSSTNKTPDFFVNWEKVIRNTKPFEKELHTINYLIGKENIYEEALVLFSEQPDLLKAIPTLLANRKDPVLDILLVEDGEMDFDQFNFRTIDTANIKEYVDFIYESGLLTFIQKHATRSLVDYVYGVEAGLDTHGRKNRSGTTMENAVEEAVKKVTSDLGLEYTTQVTASYMKQNWNLTVPVDKSKRRFDLAIYDKENHKAWLIETNYYNGGGSKLKSVAGEFASLNRLIEQSEDNVKFIWITDGQGWKTAIHPLHEAFQRFENIFNLKMLSDKYLYELFHTV